MEDNNKADAESEDIMINEEDVLTEEEFREATAEDTESLVRELNDKYLRLYADFDNYRKRVNKDKDELVKYGNESLLYELLPALDNLELALKHAQTDLNAGLVQGVEITLKEFLRVLDKFGLTRIEAAGMQFDPALHHAMMQVERNDIKEKMVVDEMRTGYKYRDKVLRPSLVSVSVRPKTASGPEEAEENSSDSTRPENS